MSKEGCGHEHESPVAELACATLAGLIRETQSAGCIVLVEEGDDGEALPYASIRGNMTDVAHMVWAMLDAVLEQPRPTDCIACMSNYDAMQRARTAMDEIVGRC